MEVDEAQERDIDGIEIPSNNEGIDPLFEQLVKKLNRNGVQDLFEKYLEYCNGDEPKMLLTFLKIFLAIVPEGSLRDMLTAQEVNIELGYNVEELLNDLKELKETYPIQKKKRIYLRNLENFLKEMLSSENWTSILKENHNMLTALNTMMRNACVSQFNDAREAGVIALLEMFCWLLKHENELLPSNRSLGDGDSEDSMHMDEDVIDTSQMLHLSSNLAKALNRMTETLINDTITGNRIKVLISIRSNFRNHFDIVKPDGILRGLAFSIMCNVSAQIDLGVKLLWEILDNGFTDPKLINWFFQNCQISKNCHAEPINLLIGNIWDGTSAETIKTILKIIHCLEKCCPGRINPVAAKYVYLRLITSSKDIVEHIGKFQHAISCGLSGSQDLKSYNQYEKYMKCFTTFNHDLSTALALDLIVNSLMGLPDCPLLNFEYFMKFMLSGDLTGIARIELLNVLKCVLLQLQGIFHSQIVDVNKVMLVKDMSVVERKEKMLSLVYNFSKFLGTLLTANEGMKRPCLLECVDIITKIPLDLLHPNLYLEALKELMFNILFDHWFDFEAKSKAFKLMVHLQEGGEPNFKEAVTCIIRATIGSFDTLLGMFGDEHIQVKTARRGIESTCENVIALFDHFNVSQFLEQFKGRNHVHFLSKVLSFKDDSEKVNIHEMELRHTLLVMDINNTIEAFKGLNDEENMNPIRYFSKVTSFYSENIPMMTNLMVGLLGNLDNPDQIRYLEIICKELNLLLSMMIVNPQADPERFTQGVIAPLRDWVYARFPRHDTKIAGTMHPDKIPIMMGILLSMFTDKPDLINYFREFVAFSLYTNHPMAERVITEGDIKVELTASILYLVMEYQLIKMKDMCLTFQKKNADELAELDVCMKIIKNIILKIMQKHYYNGKVVAQKTLDKLASAVYEVGPDVWPEMMVSTFMFPWFKIIFDYCMPPTIYSYQDIKNWKSLAKNHPNIPFLIVKLCKRIGGDERLIENVRDLIYEPEKYFTSG